VQFEWWCMFLSVTAGAEDTIGDNKTKFKKPMLTHLSLDLPSRFERCQFHSSFFDRFCGPEEFVLCDKGRVRRVDPIVVFEHLGGGDQFGDALRDLARDGAQVRLGLARVFASVYHHDLKQLPVLQGSLSTGVEGALTDILLV
jgi:hypothetical protein